MAHNVVGRVVRETIEAGRIATDITTADLDEASQALFGHALGIPESKVRTALDPAENLKTRTVTGGPAPERMADMLTRRKASLDHDAGETDRILRRIADADTQLEAQARQVVAEAGLPVQTQIAR
jgi:argininosuccinate lyase